MFAFTNVIFWGLRYVWVIQVFSKIKPKFIFKVGNIAKKSLVVTAHITTKTSVEKLVLAIYT